MYSGCVQPISSTKNLGEPSQDLGLNTKSLRDYQVSYQETINDKFNICIPNTYVFLLSFVL